jgi:hypothetical protein
MPAYEKGGEDTTVTYPVQIINQPYHIIVMDVSHTLDILLPIKYVAELIWELG